MWAGALAGQEWQNQGVVGGVRVVVARIKSKNMFRRGSSCYAVWCGVTNECLFWLALTCQFSVCVSFLSVSLVLAWLCARLRIPVVWFRPKISVQSTMDSGFVECFVLVFIHEVLQLFTELAYFLNLAGNDNLPEYYRNTQ